MTPTRRHSRANGFTVIEAVFCTIIVSGMLLAALTSLAAARAGEVAAADAIRGQALAEALMSEIMQREYGDETPGLEASESLAGDRRGLDDVDDYHGLDETTLRREDGAVLNGYAGWRRRVSVERVRPEAPGAVSAVASGVKRVTVRVERGTKPVAELVAIRTDVWRDPALLEAP